MIRVIFATVAIAFTAAWLFVWRAPFGAGNWAITPNEAAWPLGAWLLPVGVVVIFGGAATLSVYDRFKRAKSRKERTNSTITALVCLAVIGMLWPWAMQGPGKIKSGAGGVTTETRPTLEGRFNIIASLWSDLATEYFGAAYQFDDARAYMRTYAQTQQQPKARTQAHVATHPPGAVLWFYGVRKITESSPALQNALLTLAQTVTDTDAADLPGLAQQARAAPSAQNRELPVPSPLPATAVGTALACAILLGLSLVAALPAVYGLGAIGGGENAEKRGLIAAALWMTAPTTNLFAFTLDALVACGAVWTLYFAALGWNRMSSQGAGIAHPSNRISESENLEENLSLAPSKSANFWWIASGIALTLTTFLSIGAFAVGAILIVAVFIYRPRGGARALALSVGAFILMWTILALWGGFNPLEIALNAGRAHRFATLETRGYWPWVWLNLAVWAPFIGWPVVALLARGVKLYKENAARARSSAVGFGLGIATLIVLLLLCLSGNVRGEAERLWLFSLAPLCVLAAFHDELRWRVWAPLLALQALQTLLMSATLAPLVRPF